MLYSFCEILVSVSSKIEIYYARSSKANLQEGWWKAVKSFKESLDIYD